MSNMLRMMAGRSRSHTPNSAAAVNGNQLVDSEGNPLQLRGVNYSGYEFSPIQGFSPEDSSGAQAGQADGPNIDALVAWGVQVLRITLNQAAWLGQITFDTAHVMHDADPRRTYRADIIDIVTRATAAGLRVILDLHWTNPSLIAPMQQQLMADAVGSPRLWTSVANIPEFKNNPSVMFELFNEPVLTYAIKSGGTAWPVMMQGGVMDYLECTAGTIPYSGAQNTAFRQVFSMTLSGVTGDPRPGTVMTKGGISTTVVYYDHATRTLYHRNPTGTFTTGATLSTQTRRGRAMIGRDVPAFASAGTAANAVNANYNNSWRATPPCTIAFDISGITSLISTPINASRPLLIAWYSEDTYGYDCLRLNTPGNLFNLPADYTIEVNSAAGGGAAPTTGWVAVKAVTGNYHPGRQHLINVSGQNWWRFNCTAIRGVAPNADCKVQFDMWEASDTVTGTRANALGTATTDGILFIGDSIFANTFRHIDNSAQVPTPSMGDTVFTTTGHVPPYMNAGMPGWKTADFLADNGAGTTIFEEYVALCPYRYVAIGIGANDANGSAVPAVSPAVYSARMLSLAQKVIAAGKVPIIPTITFSNNPTRNTGHQALNAALATLLAAHPEIIAGPDQYAYFAANSSLINPFPGPDSGLHPTTQGCADLRTVVWGDWCANTLYKASGAITAVDVGWETAGYQDMIDAVRATGATNVVLVGGVNFSNELDGWLANAPTDPLQQLVCAWHPYPWQKHASTLTVASPGQNYVIGDTIDLPFVSNAVYIRTRVTVSSVNGSGGVTGFTLTNAGRYLATSLPTNPLSGVYETSGVGSGAAFNITAYANHSSVWSDPANRPQVEAIAAIYPVLCTETGEFSYTGRVGSPYLDDFLGWADDNRIGVLGWTWDMFGAGTPASPASAVLIKDVTGTPTEGYGEVFKDWIGQG